MKWYAKNMKHKGFTVVELVIVIVVIAILASIVIVSYSFMTTDAMDTKRRSAVRTAGDALTLYESKNGSRVSGTGTFNVANGMDTLTPTYLKTGYRDGITSKNATNANNVFRWYPCNDGNGGFVIYASLNNPTAEDIANFNNIRASTACNTSVVDAPISGNPQYNYAQTF